MAKSIIQVDVDDSKFKEFQALFQKYQDTLAKQPQAWGRVNKETGKLTDSFQDAAEAMMKMVSSSNAVSKSTKKLSKSSESAFKSWLGIAKAAHTTGSELKKMVGSVFQIAGIGSIFGGLLGGGSLFGLSRLAASAASQSRSAIGIGATVGQKSAFGTRLGQYLNADTFLGGVNEAMSDPSKRSSLYGAGLTESQIQGKTSAEVAAAMIPSIWKMLKETDPSMRQSMIQAHGLNQFGNLQDYNRLADIDSEDNLRDILKKFVDASKSLDIPKKQNEAWINFNNQLDESGQKIKNVFITALTPLAPQLERLSTEFSKSAEALLKTKDVGAWIDNFAGGLRSAANYVGSPKFQSDVDLFVRSVGQLAQSMVNGLRWLHLIPEADEAKKANSSAWMYKPNVGPNGGFSGNYHMPATVGGDSPWFDSRFHNPGNLRVPGSTTEFQKFSTEKDGVLAMARQLQIYQRRDHLDTIDQIVSKYAPSNENDTKRYIENVVGRTGYSANQKLDLNDTAVLSNLMAAMTKQENSKSPYTPQSLNVIITNATGGSAVVSTNQLAGN